VVAVQNSYGLGYRAQQDEFIRQCGEQGVAFVPFFSIAGANREAGGGTDAAVRLAWTLARGPHILVIPGTGDPGHLAENVAAGDLRLSEEELARLDELHRTGSG
jgi:aryl-alcohol dehydrogenase-like predicted oxidoreductase